MLYRLRDRLRRHRFRRACRDIYATPPLESAKGGAAVLTQLQHKDVILFLVAVKTFARQVPVGAVFVLDDGSLTPTDRGTLEHHVPGCRILPIGEFRHPRCPRGGTWERLLAIATLGRERYLIQLDSDTLTRSPLPEVARFVERGTAFTLGTWDNQTIEPMRRCSERVAERLRGKGDPHVQLAAEAAFQKLAGVEGLRYVRGCSGFAGFPPGTADPAFIADFSQEMETLLGRRWHEWGSEQVMSNVVVANAPDAEVLPHPDYSDCTKMTATTRFIHFVGNCRFAKGIYAREARKAIAGLGDRHAP